MSYANDSQQYSRGLTDAENPIETHLDHAAQEVAAISVSVRSGYRRPRGGDPVAIFASLALVAVIGGAFATMAPTFIKKQVAAPVVVTLLTLPDDPPPAESPPPPQQAVPTPPQAQIIAPPPIVTTAERPVIQASAVLPPVSDPAPKAAPAPPAVARGPENLGEISARMISAKPPQYPMDSRRQHEEGTVVLSVLLSVEGLVSDVSVSRSSGFMRLDRAAMEAVRGWRWSPVMRDGTPVMVRGSVTIPFVLKGLNRGGRDRRGGHDRGRDQGGPDVSAVTT